MGTVNNTTVFKNSFKTKLALEMRKHLSLLKEEMLDNLDEDVKQCPDISESKEHDDILYWADAVLSEAINSTECVVHNVVEVCELGGEKKHAA